MTKTTIKFACPDGHGSTINEEKSNDNWIVYKPNCAKCNKSQVPVIE